MDEVIIAFVVRWGFASAKLLHLAYPDDSAKAWGVRLARLEKTKRLKSYPLRGRERSYILTRGEALDQGLHEKRAKPFGSQATIVRLGQMLYCLTNGLVKRTREEIETNSPELKVRGLSCDRYVPLPGHVIGILVSDCGSKAGAIAEKAAKEVYKRRDRSEVWKERIRLRGLKPIVIIGDERKGRRIKNRLTDRGFDFEVAVFEALAPFILERTK